MVKVAGIDWDGTGHSRVRLGKIDGKEVARLRKNKNHTHTNDGVWSVEILGSMTGRDFRYARDAQLFAADELAKRK